MHLWLRQNLKLSTSSSGGILWQQDDVTSAPDISFVDLWLSISRDTINSAWEYITFSYDLLMVDAAVYSLESSGHLMMSLPQWTDYSMRFVYELWRTCLYSILLWCSGGTSAFYKKAQW